MPLVCGIDSSTQSTKVEIRDADTGALVASGRARHPATTPPVSEQHPGDWWTALGAALSQATGELPSPVAAVSVAGQQHGLVVLDSSGRVIRPAKLWNDTTSAPQAARLVEALGASVWAQACGSVPVAAFTITKLAWLADNEPDALRSVRRVLLPHDWLTWQLCGSFVTDRGDASGTGYWSPATGTWAADLLSHVADLDWPSMLPEVCGPVQAAGRATPGPLRGALVGPGTGDNMAAALALGMRPGDVAMSIGTSGTIYAVSESPTADASGAVAGFADATGRFLPLVCTLNATKVTETLARLLGVDVEELSRLALASPPGAAGLVLLPYLDGERTPNLPDATGVLSGLQTTTTREHAARAAFEGVVNGLLDGLGALEAQGVEAGGRFFLVGGGARSDAFRQTVATLADRSVRVPDADELVAAGACVQAAAVLHGTDPVEVAAAWDLSAGTDVESDRAVDARSIRDAYAAQRTAAQRGM